MAASEPMEINEDWDNDTRAIQQYAIDEYAAQRRLYRRATTICKREGKIQGIMFDIAGVIYNLELKVYIDNMKSNKHIG